MTDTEKTLAADVLAERGVLTRRAPMSATHDYTRATWGHALTFMQVEPDGRKANVLGFGSTVREGDYLLLANGPGETTRFRIAKLKWLRPSDHWKADIEFAPRQEGSC